MANKIFHQRQYAPRSKAFLGRPDCTPFLDVFFLLLIFLIMSLPFVQLSGVEVSLPQVEAGKVRTGLERFIVTIAQRPDGSTQLYFNDKPLSQDQLAEELSEVSLKTEMKMVIVRADAKVPHAVVTEVMTLAARFGLSTFLATGHKSDTTLNRSEPFVPPAE
jgi:biopolymer transport protein ExbD